MYNFSLLLHKIHVLRDFKYIYTLFIYIFNLEACQYINNNLYFYININFIFCA